MLARVSSLVQTIEREKTKTRKPTQAFGGHASVIHPSAVSKLESSQDRRACDGRIVRASLGRQRIGFPVAVSGEGATTTGFLYGRMNPSRTSWASPLELLIVVCFRAIPH